VRPVFEERFSARVLRRRDRSGSVADVSPDGFDVVGDVDGLGVESVGALGDGVGDGLLDCPCLGPCGRECGGPK
jgi:hypothetical protein